MEKNMKVKNILMEKKHEIEAKKKITKKIVIRKCIS